jgi:uncharacterized protein with GYD domain
MPHYVTLVRYTAQGLAKVKDSPTRLDNARKGAEKAGGKIHAWYLTMDTTTQCSPMTTLAPSSHYQSAR